MKSNMARIMLAAPASGSGKTMLTCGLLAAFKKRQLHIAAMKCGPDYIDPMFHRKVLGICTGNLDSYFMSEDDLINCLVKKAIENDITIVEGVMGYYDGLGGATTQASAYEIARVTKTAAILIVDCKGASVTLATTIKGMIDFRPDSNIAGVILNRITEGFYEKIKPVIEHECGVPVVGYVPILKDMEVPSRHLGLYAPEEMEAFGAWANRLAEIFEKTIDLDRILAFADAAEALVRNEKHVQKETKTNPENLPTIAVARDEAFAFYYDENMELLKKLGAKLIEFSPLRDRELPSDVDGLVLGGGYPELYAKMLSENVGMRTSIHEKCMNGLPCIAECGGFLYLQKSLEGDDKTVYPMCDVLHGEGFRTTRLQRFGYMEAVIDTDGMIGKHTILKGHEFHYWDCTQNGADATAYKPTSPDKQYKCIVHTDTMFAGFPHFNYYSNPEALRGFVRACSKYKQYKERTI